MKALDVDLDVIMEDVGRVGKYQIKHFFWTMILVILCSTHSSTYIFTTQDVEYRCHVPGCDGPDKIFEQAWISNAIPFDEKCSRFPFKWGNSSSENSTDESTCPSSLFDSSTQVYCSGHVFKTGNTFIEEMNIPCQNWKRTLVGTMNSIGTLIALPIVGAFSDRFGRRHALILSSLMEGIFGISKSFAVNYPMFLALEASEPVLGSGWYSSAYILALEILTPTTRVMGGALVSTYFSIGQIIMGFLAWNFPYWRTFLQVIYAPSLLAFAFYLVLDESVRWLISKQKYQKAMDTIKKIAAINGKTVPQKALKDLQYNIDNCTKFKEEETKCTDNREKEISAWRLALRSRILMLRVLKVSVWWITCIFCVYGLSIYSTVLPGNSYANFILTCVGEIPSQIVGYYGMTHFGRKGTLFVSFLGGGLSLLTFAIVPSDLQWLALVVYLFGKFFTVMAVGCVYLYTSELFPTPMRHSLVAACSTVGRIGSILAPQTLLLVVYMKQLPSLLFASTCLISAVLMIGSPETLNMKLPETVEEAENISAVNKKIVIENTRL